MNNLTIINEDEFNYPTTDCECGLNVDKGDVKGQIRCKYCDIDGENYDGGLTSDEEEPNECDKCEVKGYTLFELDIIDKYCKREFDRLFSFVLNELITTICPIVSYADSDGVRVPVYGYLY